MTDTILGPVSCAEDCATVALKRKWRELFDTEPPPYNRRFLEHRLAYRIQELAYGGLKQETVERLEALADELEGKAPPGAGAPANMANCRHPADPRIRASSTA